MTRTLSTPPAEQRAPLRHLLATCFVLAAICFGASTFYAQYATRAADAPLADLSARTVPSIAHLSAARTLVVDLVAALEDALAGARPIGTGVMRRALGDLEHTWSAYEGLQAKAAPRDEAEAIAAFRAAAADVRDQLAIGDPATAHRSFDVRLRPAAQHADEALGTLLAKSSGEATTIVVEAARSRRHSAWASFAFEGASLALALVLAVAAFRAVRTHTEAVEERAKELELFAARVAHDIRGPLTPAVVALDTGRLRVEDPKLRAGMERGLRSLRIVQSLVDAMFDFARSGAPADPLARADVRSALEGVLAELRALATATHVALDVEPFEDCAAACAPGVLASILANLIRNAIVHMGDAPVRTVRVRVQCGTVVRVEVEDSGPGMSADELAHALDGRARVRSSIGLGLGLATVRRFVEAHDGRMTVRSAVGRGTTFRVELPAVLRPSVAPRPLGGRSSDRLRA